MFHEAQLAYFSSLVARAFGFIAKITATSKVVSLVFIFSSKNLLVRSHI